MAIIMMEVMTMPRGSLRFRFEEHPRIRARMEACADIQQQTVDYALENGKTATFTLIKALYPSLRAQHPDLHAVWVQSAVRAGAAVVHSFRNRQRKGKTQLQKPEIRRPFVYARRDLLRIEWDGELLTVTIPVSPRDPEPIVLTFRPHHRYRRLLDEWKAGRAKMGEPTLTAHSLSIPLKFPDPIPYEPEGVIGIDRNEGNLTAFVTSTGEIREIDTGDVGKVNRDPQNTSRACPVCGRVGERRRGWTTVDNFIIIYFGHETLGLGSSAGDKRYHRLAVVSGRKASCPCPPIAYWDNLGRSASPRRYHRALCPSVLR